MIKEMTSYFTAEKQESLLFVLVGLLAIGVAAWLWMNGHRLRSMAYPLVAVALMQIMVGASVYMRTDNQLAALEQQFSSSPAEFKAQETQRMDVVMRNFSIYKKVEMALLILGLLLIAFAQKFDLATGIGVGLLMQAAFTLCLDMFAEARGNDYLAAVRAVAL
jgi:hypothetical protein